MWPPPVATLYSVEQQSLPSERTFLYHFARYPSTVFRDTPQGADTVIGALYHSRTSYPRRQTIYNVK